MQTEHYPWMSYCQEVCCSFYAVPSQSSYLVFCGRQRLARAGTFGRDTSQCFQVCRVLMLSYQLRSFDRKRVKVMALTNANWPVSIYTLPESIPNIDGL
jgi:hypothetical protein